MKLQEYINNKEDKANIKSLDFADLQDIELGELTFDGTDWPELEEIIFGEKQLQGTLKIVNCENLKRIICSNNYLNHVDLSQIAEIKTISYEWSPLSMMSGIELIYPYPVRTYTKTKKVIKLSLRELNLANNKIVRITWPQKLKDIKTSKPRIKLDVGCNKLVNFYFLAPIAENLVELNLSNNDFPSSDLRVFRRMPELECLALNNNLFEGSLKYLKDLELKKLNINDTNITEGLEYIASYRLEEFHCLSENKKILGRSGVVQLGIDLGLDLYKKGSKSGFASALVRWNTKRLEREKEKVIQNLKAELEVERETNRESAEKMDNYYRRQFIHDNNIENVRNEMSKEILELNIENRILKKENQRLQEQLKIIEQIAQIEINSKSK